MRDGVEQAWRAAKEQSAQAEVTVREAKREAAEAVRPQPPSLTRDGLSIACPKTHVCGGGQGVSTVNPGMSTVEQRQAARDEGWRRRQVVRVLETRRGHGGRLDAKVRWRAHGPSRDSWEDAEALGLMEQGVVTPGLNATRALQQDCKGGIGTFVPLHFAH